MNYVILKYAFKNVDFEIIKKLQKFLKFIFRIYQFNI